MAILSGWFERRTLSRKVNESLSYCDHASAAVELRRRFAGQALSEHLVGLLKAYLAKPGARRAKALVDYDYRFLAVFYDNRRSPEFRERLSRLMGLPASQENDARKGHAARPPLRSCGARWSNGKRMPP